MQESTPDSDKENTRAFDEIKIYLPVRKTKTTSLQHQSALLDALYQAMLPAVATVVKGGGLRAERTIEVSFISMC